MMTKMKQFVTIVLALLVAGTAIAADEPTVEPRADMLLQRMGAVLAAAEGFTVATAPAGATVSYVPQGYTTTTVNGTIYYEYAGVDYQPKMVDGGTAYVVVQV